MKKVFITNIPLQGNKGLETVEYVPEQFELTKENRKTAFPIIPIIAEHLEDMGETEIIAIRIDNDDTKENFNRFLEEVESLGLEKNCVKVLLIPEVQDSGAQRDMMLQLIDMIPNHSVLRACITYGTKPIAVVVTYVMLYITKVLYDVEVRGIYYGEITRNQTVMTGAKLYDITGLLEIGHVIEQLNGLQIEDVKSALKSLFS